MQGHGTAHPAPPPSIYPPERLYGATGRPEASDIHQGGQGDCYFLSSMGALARQQPALVAGAIGYDQATHDTLSRCMTRAGPHGRSGSPRTI